MQTPLLLTHLMCVKDALSSELNLCMLHIWQTFLHNDKLEKKIFLVLSQVPQTKKVPFGTITCTHTYMQGQAQVYLVMAKLPREAR